MLRAAGCALTFVDLHVCYRLPLVHCDKPGALSTAATAQVNDQLVGVTTKNLEDRVQS